MLCNKCGANNPADALFCSNCGSRLDEAKPLYGSENPVPPATPVAPATSVEPAAPVPPVGNPYTVMPDPTSAPYAQPGTVYGGSAGVPKAGDPSKNWAAVTGLVCAILSFPCCLLPYIGILFAIAAVVFSVIGLKSRQKDLAIGALVVAIIGVLINLFMLVAVFVTMVTPEFQGIMEEVLRTMEL